MPAERVRAGFGESAETASVLTNPNKTTRIHQEFIR